ncbi:MAG TPA: hypothetical protein VF262_03675 [Burkholderiales bacterium]|jgi:hypothetical protein
MKRSLLLAVLATLPLCAAAQGAPEAQTKVLQDIAGCLSKGLPPDWRQAEMFVTLRKPGDETGSARYTMIRNLTGGEIENFLPCSDRNPAKMLVTEVRKHQAGDKRGWTRARFTIYREGKFDLTFDYPKRN